jgi:hypothetical protein
MEDLELGDGVLAVLAQPGLGFDQVVRNRRRHPTVALAEQPDEVRSAPLDLGETERQHLALGRLLVGDAPSQVDLRPGHRARLAELPELGKEPLDQDVPSTRRKRG